MLAAASMRFDKGKHAGLVGLGTKLRCEEFLDELAQLNGRDDCIPLLDCCHFHVFLVVQRMRVYEIDIRGFFKNILFSSAFLVVCTPLTKFIHTNLSLHII